MDESSGVEESSPKSSSQTPSTSQSASQSQAAPQPPVEAPASNASTTASNTAAHTASSSTAGTNNTSGAATSATGAASTTASGTTATASHAAAATVPITKKQGFKVFILGFLGALVACVIALGVSSALNQNSSSVVLGSNGSGTSITVNGDDATLAEVVAQKVLPTVVNINVYTAASQSPMQQLMGESSSEEYQQSSLGSGVILSADGYILTNYHVIENADKLQVVATGGEYDAKVVGTDPSSDLAVIKIDASNLSAAEIGSSSDLVTGEWVMAVGSPFGLEQSVSTGIVSATSRSSSSLYSSESEAVYTNMIQTDAAINPGNSGGALVDKDGKLIGINTLIASNSGTSSGVGFAIPVDYAMKIADQIIAGEKPSHAQLGVSLSTVNSQIAARYNLPVDQGAYVANVTANSGAAKAGIEEGDIITKVNDTEITSANDLIIAVRSHNPGDKVTVTYYHGNDEKTAEVELGKDS